MGLFNKFRRHSSVPSKGRKESKAEVEEDKEEEKEGHSSPHSSPDDSDKSPRISKLLRRKTSTWGETDPQPSGQPSEAVRAAEDFDISVNEWKLPLQATVYPLDNAGLPIVEHDAPNLHCGQSSTFHSVVEQMGRLPLERIHHYALNGEFIHALLRDRRLVDVLVHVGDRVFYAHRVILCSHSRYLSGVLLDAEIPANVVTDLTLKSCEPQMVKDFIYFAYTGEIQLTKNNVSKWIKISKQLDSDSLQAQVKVFLDTLEPMDLDQAMAILLKGEEDFTKPIAINAVTVRFQEVLDGSDTWYQLSLEDLLEILDSSQLSVSSEIDVFWTVLFWVAYDLHKRSPHLDELMSRVRFTCMSSMELLDCARASNLIRLSEKCTAMLLGANWVSQARETGLDDPLDLPRETQRVCLQHLPPYKPAVAEFDLRYIRYKELLGETLDPSKNKKFASKKTEYGMPRKSVAFNKNTSMNRKVKEGRLNLNQSTLGDESSKPTTTESFNSYLLAKDQRKTKDVNDNGQTIQKYELSNTNTSHFEQLRSDLTRIEASPLPSLNADHEYSTLEQNKSLGLTCLISTSNFPESNSSHKSKQALINEEKTTELNFTNNKKIIDDDFKNVSSSTQDSSVRGKSKNRPRKNISLASKYLDPHETEKKYQSNLLSFTSSCEEGEKSNTPNLLDVSDHFHMMEGENKEKNATINLWQSSMLESKNTCLLPDSILLPIKKNKTSLAREKT